MWIGGGVLAGLAATVAILIARFEPVARSYVISALSRRYKSDVELGNLRISLFPLVHATGDNLVLRLKGHQEPMIEIRRFTIEARFIGFFQLSQAHPKTDAGRAADSHSPEAGTAG